MTFARRTHDLNTGNSLTEEKIENEFDAIYNVFNGTTDVEVELKGGLTIEAQSGFSAYRAAAQSIPSSVLTTVIFSTEVYDTLGEYDHATGIFTATQAGTYLCTWIVQLTSAAWTDNEFFVTECLKNNLVTAGNIVRGMFTYQQGSDTNGKVSKGSHIFKLSIGDTLRIKAHHDQGAAVNTSAAPNGNAFAVQKIA